MTQHVLCSIDLTHSEESAAVLLEADKQATLNNAKLTVITVIPDYGSSWVGSFFKEGTLRKAVELANTALNSLVNDTLPNRNNVETVIKVGVVYEKVLKSIKTLEADLVVLGAHKPSVLDNLMGPNAARIVRTSPVSTLVVRLN